MRRAQGQDSTAWLMFTLSRPSCGPMGAGDTLSHDVATTIMQTKLLNVMFVIVLILEVL
jgi:hypothetical protein